MRLLLTTDTMGGVWTFTAELARGLLARGHNVLLISFGRLPSEPQMQQIGFGGLDFLATDVPLEWMEANGACLSRTREVLERQIDQFKPDVVHASQFAAAAACPATPCVLTIHSDVLSWAEVCQPEGLEDSAWKQCYLECVRAGLGGADRLTAPTAWMADTFRRLYSLPEEPRVISNGRTLTSAASADKKLQAVSCGRLWDPAKNVQVLEQISAPCPILVCGETSPDSAMPDSRPRYLGVLSEQAMLDLFAASSFYLATSRYEPFGLAPLEAALAGCIVFAHDIASLREVWGEAAVYFDSAASLSQSLERYCVSAALREQARQACTERALSFSAERMTTAYETLFAELTAAPALRALHVH